ncbi:hypothetical protein ACI8AF_04960 [Blastococcus sp. SYSU D00669]
MTGSEDDDDLRARLARLDPAGPQVPVDPATGLRAAELRERAVQSTDVPTDLTTRRRPLARLAAAAAVAAALVVALVVGGGGSREPTTAAFSLPAPDAAASCLAFDVAVLRDMPVAFAGTVTAADTERVTLDVDRWYAGGEAERVTLAVPPGQTSAALDGVGFRAGERYLVTAAADGTVNGCGYSGPATPEVEAAFEEAFGG